MRWLRGVGIVISVMLALEMLAAVSALPNLRSLDTRHDLSPDTDLNLNKILVDSKLSGSTVKPLTLPTQVGKGEEVKSSNDLARETIYAVNITPDRVKVWINEWKERKMAPLQRCNSLKLFRISNTKVEELPDRWVAACPDLVSLIVWRAKNLTNLPANLLEGATALKYLDFRYGVLESLPDGFLVGAPNLRHLLLHYNRLTMLTSASFVGPTGLASLYLRDNQLTIEAMRTIASLTTLKSLDIKNNPLSNLCTRNGYSMFRNLTNLRGLYVAGLNITHLCRDWSEMKFLKHLDFSKTQITELDFADVYLTRDPSVETMTYTFDNVRLEKLRLTQAEYDLGNRSPPKTNLSFISDNLMRIDCDVMHTTFVGRTSFGWIPYMPCLALEILEN